jgi:hypothetical protein
MPILTRARVDVLLAREAMLLGERINPVSSRFVTSTPTDDKSGVFPVFSREDMMRDDAQESAPGAVAPDARLAHTFSPFNCRRFKLRTPLYGELVENAGDLKASLPTVATRMLTRKLLLRRERLFSSTIFGNGFSTNWAGVASGPTGPQFLRWSDAASSPLNDIANLRTALRARIGDLTSEDLVFVCGYDVFERLRLHPEIRALASGGNPSAAFTPNTMTEADLARILGVREVMPLGAHFVAVAEGTATASAPGVALATNVAGLYYQPATASPLEPTAVKAFHWRAYDGGNDASVAVRRYRDEPSETDFVEATIAPAFVVAAADCGAVLTQVLTA